MKFSNLISHQNMLKNLDNLGYTNPTQIQIKSIPIILDKQDLLAIAKTGSGKTLAFGIPILLDIYSNKKTSSLILAPTRELANQISTELKKLAKFEQNIKILTLCGGTPMKAQTNSLLHGANIIVATPGRILAHLKSSNLQLNHLKTLVLDEADKMLDMGFLEDIQKILDFLPSKRQTLLFSATCDDAITKLSKTIQQNRITLNIDEEKPKIEEIFLPYSEDVLLKSISHFQPKRAIIFCNTKIKCQEIEDFLISHGFDALSIHSDLEQYQRDETLIEFLHESINFLVATDVASRGLDIPDVDLVINYDIPNSKEIYTHRIGRSARMEKTGIAISFVKNEDIDYLEKIRENFTFLQNKSSSYKATYTSYCIGGGKKQKLRKMDILGAFINEKKLDSSYIGKITINSNYSYISIAKSATKEFGKSIKIKKREFRLWRL